MISDEQRDKKMDLIKSQVKFLEPSFDTVMVFCTKYDPETGETSQFNYGTGNWFARAGQMRDWLVYNDAKTAKLARED